jgi:hypothetical protein
MPLLRRRAKRADKPRPGRQAIAKKDQDSLLTAIMTWIPVEVIAVYKLVMGFIPLDYQPWRFWLTVIVLVVTPFWIAFATTPTNGKTAWRQVILAPIAFVCWIAALQEDVAARCVSEWQPWMGSVVLGVGTLLLPIFDGALKKLGVPQN